MKICSKCGAHNSNERQFCIDCSQRLGKMISSTQERAISAELDKTIDKLYNKDEPLYISSYDKIIGIISILGIIVLVVIGVINMFRNCENEFLFLGIISLIMSTFVALFPKISWSIEKLRLSFAVSNWEDLKPSLFYLFCRRFTSLIFAIFGFRIVVMSIFNFTYSL